METNYDSLAWFMPQYQRSLAGQERKEKQRYMSLAQQEKEIFKRLDNILRRLVAIVRSEKQELTQQIQTQTSILCQLPSDITYLIAKRLLLFDYWSFRATCKMFKAAFLPEPEWRTPLFIYFKDSIGSYEVKDPCHNTSSCSGTLDGQHVRYLHTIMASTKNGWVLGKSVDEKLQYFNLFTNMGVYITPQHEGYIRCCFIVGFSTHPTSHDCVTVGYCCKTYFGGYEPVRHYCIAYLSSRFSTIWKHLDLHETFSKHPTSVVYHNEAFYFMDEHGYVGVFKLVGQEASWKFHGKQVDINEAYFRPLSSHLIDCDGDLLSVFIGIHRRESDNKALKGGAGGKFMEDHRLGVKVFRFNDLMNKWLEVKSLGNYSLFIGPTSFSAVVRECNVRDMIYLPWLHDNFLTCYSLKFDRVYIGGRKSSENLSKTRLLKHCWV